MGRIVASFFMSLDGVVEAPHEWHFPYFDDAMGGVVEEGMRSQTAYLMGRRLYDEWAGYWPSQDPAEPFASFINGLPKYVLSHGELGAEPWVNASRVPGDAVESIRAIKARVGGDIGMSGCATTVRWLIAHGLLDELNLLMHPIVVGGGQRLFEDTGTVPLRLDSSATLPSGVVHLRYAPAESPA